MDNGKGQQELVVIEPSALEAMHRGEIDSLIATAKKYPRSVTEFRKRGTELATLDEFVAAECTYRLKRREKDGGTKEIIGPSVRFAEIVAHSWGNCRAGARVISEGDKFITAQGYFADLEANVAIQYEVQRRITGREGNKYSDDMIVVTGNAACSIALRNAVLKGVPKAIWKPIWEKSQAAAKGDASTLEKRRSEAFRVLGTMGVDHQRACAAVGVEGPADVGIDELFEMAGLITAVNDGDQSIEDAFPKLQTGQQQRAAERAPAKSAKDLAAEQAGDGQR